MSDRRYFERFAAYNRWANHRLYEAVASLPDDAYRRDRRAFFGSIHGTLNHLLVGDRVWLGRITGAPSGIDDLATVLYEERDALRAAREGEDARLVEVVRAIDDARLETDLVYADMRGEPQRTPLTLVLAHVFNHQTHHRGQIHDMIGQDGVAPPSLDLIYFLREAA